jgi:hypothetical protein
LTQLAWWKCQRYFVERANQDAKSELGWEDIDFELLQQLRILGVGLRPLVLSLCDEPGGQHGQGQMVLPGEVLLGLQLLLTLSFANVRSLLRAVMPLRQLDTQQAIDQVVEHLFNRTQSRKSRLNKQRAKNAFT